MSIYVNVGLIIIFAILAFVLYHRIFDITYSSLDTLVAEIAGCFIVGVLLTALTLNFWKITLVLIVLVGGIGVIHCERMASKIAVGIITIIVAVLIAHSGKEYIKTQEKTSQKTTMQQIPKILENVEIYINDRLACNYGIINRNNSS